MSHSSRPGYGGSSTNKKGVNTSKYTPKMYAPKPRNTGVNSNNNSNDDREKTIKELDSLISRPKPKPPEETTTPKIKPKPKPPKEETTPKTTFKIKPKPKPPKEEDDYSIFYEKDYAYDKRFSRSPSKVESTSNKEVINPKLNSGLMSEFNTEILPEVILNSFTKDTTPSQFKEIKFQIADSINSIAKDNLSPSAYTILATSTAIADIALFKKEFRVNLNDSSNITANWKDSLSLMYNLKLGVN